MSRLALAALLLSSRANADEATATAAYQQAEALAKQGKHADACPLYEASFHADPKLGAKLHAADCQERIGHNATAWAEFNDAIELAQMQNDPRVDLARRRAAALEPKLAKLHLNPPKQLIPGLAVKRDGADITVLVGTDIPLDPGDHQIVASAAGYQDWTRAVSISAPGVVSLDIPVLDKQVVEPPKRIVHEGTLKITTLPNAEILLDQQHVGTGSYEAKIKSGGHTLRVVAGGMRSYQSEIVVGDDESRTIDVPLEKEPEPIVIRTLVGPPPDELPSYEVGVALGAGVKLHGDRPLVTIIRPEIAFRLGRRTNFGLFVEYGQIDKSNACGFNMPGAHPTTPYDFGPRNQFTECRYVMPGLQLMIHVLPASAIDPYIGLAPGFRFGFVGYTPYLGGVPQMSVSTMFPAIVASIHAGVDYRPRGAKDSWQVGGYLDASVTVFGDEAAKDQGYDNNNNNGQTFLSLFGGLRTSLTW
jgi:hypothetical protein